METFNTTMQVLLNTQASAAAFEHSRTIPAPLNPQPSTLNHSRGGCFVRHLHLKPIMQILQRFLPIAGIAALCWMMIGCKLAMLSVGGPTSDDKSKDTNPLPPLTLSRDAIELEIVFVERPVGDPLLGSLLWNEVDQIGALDPEVRNRLRDNGLRVGHVGSTPPQALQTLLGLATEIPGDADRPTPKNLSGRRVALASGTQTIIQTSPHLEECSVKIRDGDAATAEHYSNARGVLRLKAERLQDGWVELEFLPEIHHGSHHLRHTASSDGWKLDSTQLIEPLYRHRFTITANLGEMAVITVGGEDPESLGHCFFRTTETTNSSRLQIQRLLIVRLAGMKRIDPLYAE
jgi:hypothetical protein